MSGRKYSPSHRQLRRQHRPPPVGRVGCITVYRIFLEFTLFDVFAQPTHRPSPTQQRKLHIESIQTRFVGRCRRYASQRFFVVVYSSSASVCVSVILLRNRVRFAFPEFVCVRVWPYLLRKTSGCTLARFKSTSEKDANANIANCLVFTFT